MSCAKFAQAGRLNFNRIGLKAHLRTIGGKCLDYVQQDDCRPLCRLFRDYISEKMLYRLLTSAHGGACQGVRFNLEVMEFGSVE